MISRPINSAKSYLDLLSASVRSPETGCAISHLLYLRTTKAFVRLTLVLNMLKLSVVVRAVGVYAYFYVHSLSAGEDVGF